jgi:hypothetical protein
MRLISSSLSNVFLIKYDYVTKQLLWAVLEFYPEILPLETDNTLLRDKPLL